MLLITGLLDHLFVNVKTGERMFVYKVRGDVVTGVVFGSDMHTPRRVYLDELARDWRDVGPAELTAIVEMSVASHRGAGGCGDPDCIVHGTGADKATPPTSRPN